jgi:hypothetical protein
MINPSRLPKNLSSSAWYYEDKAGITVIQWNDINGTQLRVATETRITWGKLLKSLARCRPQALAAVRGELKGEKE